MDSVLRKMGRNQKPIEEMYLKSVQIAVNVEINLGTEGTKPEVDTAGSSLRKSLKVGEWGMRDEEEGKASSSCHGICVQKESLGLVP